MNQPYQPFTGKVQGILSQQIQLTDESGQIWDIPATAFESLPKIGDDIVLLALPKGGEAAGKSRFAASILNELLASD